VKSSPVDVVTAVDTASEELIVGRLLGARPDDGVLGEEGARRAGTSGVRWVVDPIDGTVNFLYDLPAYAVSIAAEVTAGAGGRRAQRRDGRAVHRDAGGGAALVAVPGRARCG
jgi:myo-inositol-1(or 4)-monophosphatase